MFPSMQSHLLNYETERVKEKEVSHRYQFLLLRQANCSPAALSLNHLSTTLSLRRGVLLSTTNTTHSPHILYPSLLFLSQPTTAGYLPQLLPRLAPGVAILHVPSLLLLSREERLVLPHFTEKGTLMAVLVNLSLLVQYVWCPVEIVIQTHPILPPRQMVFLSNTGGTSTRIPMINKATAIAAIITVTAILGRSAKRNCATPRRGEKTDGQSLEELNMIASVGSIFC